MLGASGVAHSGAPANYALLSKSARGLFSVRGLPPRTHLDRIYLNGLHTLLPFWVANESDQRLEIELTSTLGSTLKFHSQNPNWDAVTSKERESYVEVASAPGSGQNHKDPAGEVTLVCSARTQKDFSEVFNQLSGVSRIAIAPHEAIEIVLLFKATEPKRTSQTPVPSRRPSLGQMSSHSTVASNASVGESNPGQPAAIEPSAYGPVGSKSFAYMSSSAVVAIKAVAPEHVAVDEYDVQLRASFCQSVLEMDPPTSRIYLDDCVVGRLYERSLKIKNASSIGLDWTTTVVETTDSTSLSSLQLLDSDMCPLSGGHLAGNTSKSIVIRYTPHAVGEFLCRFLIENSNDPSNQRYWVFRARASQRQKPRRVDLLSDPDINFGDCTSGVWYHREVMLKNVSDAPVLMRFRVEGNIANLTMKSSVKAKQDVAEDTESGMEQQPAIDSEQPTESPAHPQSDLRTLILSESEGARYIRDDETGSTNNDDTQPTRASLHSGYMQTSNLPSDRPSGAYATDDAGSEKQLLMDTQDEVTSESGNLDAARGPGARPGAALSSLGRAGSISTHSTFSRTDATDDGLLQNAASLGESYTSSTKREAESYLSSPKDLSRRALPRIRANASHSHQPTLFDEVIIKPGAIRSVVFSLMGNPTSSSSFNAGHFARLSFTLFCEYSAAAASKQTAHGVKSASANDKNIERLSLPCTLNICTPFVRVTPALLDFGSVDVGMLKSMYLQVENLSQIEATVQCRLESKVINCIRTPIVIPPLQSESIRVDIYPRRINARYRKQIIVRNKHNRLNDNVVEVRSVHVDQRRMAYHNLFYKTLVPENEQNFVDFGTVPINTRVLRKISLSNLCRCPITLELSASDGSSSNNVDDDGMVALYTVVPLTRKGIVTEEARQVARLLPMLERQAVMHSNIEKFKEHAGGPPSAPDQDGAQQVEWGHACLVPFVREGSVVTTHPSIDYLDVATGIRTKRAVVRIRETGHHSLCATAPDMDAALETPSNSSAIADSNAVPAPAATPAGSFSVEDAATTAIVGRAGQILDEIVNHLDMVPKTLFSSPRSEDEYVRRQVDLRKYIDLLVESGFLQPAHHVTLASSSAKQVIVMLKPSEKSAVLSEKGISPPFDANLYFSLVNCPSDLLPYTDSASSTVFANSYRLPVRRFLVQASLCRSELGIGQKSINVGNMQVDETSRKYLLIQNRTEVPLMYAIRKTGSIASGDIQFVDNNRYGVVRGFDSRKIVFVFSPSLTGIYNEQISISNVLNVHGGKTATLKAVVRRPSKFYIQSLRLEFGLLAVKNPLKIGHRSSDVQVLVIRNMTPKVRHFGGSSALMTGSLNLNAKLALDPLFPADVVSDIRPAKLLDRETEEKIEGLEQKLKIAVRKNRPEKIEKYRNKLAKLRNRSTSSPVAASVKRLEGDTQLLVTLPGSADVSIPVVVIPRIAGRAEDWSETQDQRVVMAEGRLVVHEDKDKDNVKIVALVAPVELASAGSSNEVHA
ncbi:hypothetical protein GQ54DRAFT_283640 [Martensiomyces pterosporus]|nr:hypothetical protein GQ54DRAFT_283640 [Martensiomyces pterosporus]